MDATAEELIARLRRNPDDPTAYAALKSHYHRAGDVASLANLLEGWAARSPDPGAAAHAFYEAAELAWGRLSDAARAARLYEAALERHSLHPEAGERLALLFEDLGDFPRLANLLERRAEALAYAQADPRDLAAIQERLGQLWQHSFERADKALVHYRRAFELDPTRVPAIYAAREIYRQAGNAKAAAALCDLESKAESDPGRKVALLRELAHARGTELGDFEGAVAALKRALGIAPGDVEVLEDLARVHLARAAQQGDAPSAAAERERAADVFHQLAQQRRPADAVPLLESALDAMPNHEPALALLERIAEQVGHFELLPGRWVAYLASAPSTPAARTRRKRLAKAYLDAGQRDYAITCLEWLLEDGDAEAAEQLVEFYRRSGREKDMLRALDVSVRGLDPRARAPKLRELMEMQALRGDEAAAVQTARSLLDLEPADMDALGRVESHLRRRAEWLELRDFLLAAARAPGLTVEARRQRQREAAILSERRLADPAAAIGAWNGLVALDPTDREALDMLGRLLEDAQRWDELVPVLEREAANATTTEERADAFARLASVHREHRGDLPESIVALRSLQSLVPNDDQVLAALSDALLEAHAWGEGIPLLRRRIEDADGTARAELLRVLARTLEGPTADVEGAFASWARVLEDAPGDPEALERMEAIDVRAGHAERLLDTLAYRADLEVGATRSATLRRMGEIAEAQLGDAEQASEFFARAFQLTPGDDRVVDAMCAAHTRAGRHRELVMLLRERSLATDDVRLRTSMSRRIARVLSTHVRNDDAAAEAYGQVLEAGEDAEALTFLLTHAERADDLDAMDSLSGRLEAITSDPQTRCALGIERARRLADRMDRPLDAVALLRAIVEDVAPPSLEALELLAAICTQMGDRAGVADALERSLMATTSAPLRARQARALADVVEHELHDAGRAIRALQAWSEAEPHEDEPVRRLVALLEQGQHWQPLVGALDRLSVLVGEDERGAVLRRAARVSAEHLSDAEGAWARLAGRVAAGDADAEALLREVCRRSGRGPQLADLYASIAEAASDPDEKRRRWIDAARAHEDSSGPTAAALEALLKAFSLDLDDPALLDEVDRLATGATAWSRLAQVYDTLFRREADRVRKVRLLLRHATILEGPAAAPSAALDRALRAYALMPESDEVLATAEDLAFRAGRASELLEVYDRRRTAAVDDAGRVDALLRAATLCEGTLRDRGQALVLFAQAIALSVRSTELTPAIEQCAMDLDRARPPRGAPGVVQGLVDTHLALAASMQDDAEGAAALAVRAAGLLDRVLRDPARAWSVLAAAVSEAPAYAPGLDALESLATSPEQGAALDRLLAGWIDEALDGRTAAALMRRRGLWLDRLGRVSEAADVYARLRTLTPTAADVRAALRDALRRAARHQELLLALELELAKYPIDAGHEQALRKEIARTWERGLKNRWEALEAWEKVLAREPADVEARAAVDRLRKGSTSTEEDTGTVELDTGDVKLDESLRATSDPTSPQVAAPSASAGESSGSGRGRHDAVSDDAEALLLRQRRVLSALSNDSATGELDVQDLGFDTDGADPFDDEGLRSGDFVEVESQQRGLDTGVIEVRPLAHADELEADELEADELEADELEADELEADELEADELEADELEADELEADEPAAVGLQQHARRPAPAPLDADELDGSELLEADDADEQELDPEALEDENDPAPSSARPSP